MLARLHLTALGTAILFTTFTSTAQTPPPRAKPHPPKKNRTPHLHANILPNPNELKSN